MSAPISFNLIPIFVDPTLPDGEVIASEYKLGQTLRTTPLLTDEERRVRDVANRLLGVTGALTLDMMQDVADRFFAAHHTAPDTLIMSPATRREYIKLLEADRRL